MKRQIIAAAMLSALLLTACGADSIAAESQKPESSAAAESSAEESSAKADESTEKAAESAIEAEPAAEKKAEQVSFETPVAGIKLGMTIDEIRGVLGKETKLETDIMNPLYKESYTYNVDKQTVFGTDFSLPGEIICYMDASGFLSMIACTFGYQSGKAQYPSDADRQKDKDKLYALICERAGEPDKTESDTTTDGSAMFTWFEADSSEYWLCGGPALWGIEGLMYNVMDFGLSDADGNQITYSKLTGVPEKSEDSSRSDSSSKSSSSGGSKKSSSDSLRDGEYWCCGKGDTCRNKTYSPTDLYCHSCDPDDNNIEGDQRKSSGSSKKGSGEIKDTNGNGKVDEDDWEKAWKDYLNEHMN